MGRAHAGGTDRALGPGETHRPVGANSPARGARPNGLARTARTNGLARTARTNGPGSAVRTNGPGSAVRTNGPARTVRPNVPGCTARPNVPGCTARESPGERGRLRETRSDHAMDPRQTVPAWAAVGRITSMKESTIHLAFDRGTVLLKTTGSSTPLETLPGIEFDSRVSCWRAPARFYRTICDSLREMQVDLEDQASTYETLELRNQLDRPPHPYQRDAVSAWLEAGSRGVVVLPTGAGKTYVAQLIMEATQRSTLVVTPTIDLMQQWYGVLLTGFSADVGLIGGGEYDVRSITVTTYDSAYIHMDRLGGNFGLIVFDECHHLPGPSYGLAAEASLAPYRLGLTATPEREDGAEHRLDELIGPIVYRKDIVELAGEYLSEYETRRLRVHLSEDERERYQTSRAIYLDFLRAHRIRMGSPSGWTRFLTLSAQSEAGRRAFFAYREQKAIAEASEAKIRLLERLLESHRSDRVLIFTNDNDTVYRVSRQFLIPAITHQTKVKERREILERFNRGVYPMLVTSKVLNEGVDVPEANVGIVLSGSGSVREHVQRLGRILRRGEQKQAILYEMIAERTSEESVSDRRRNHNAYF